MRFIFKPLTAGSAIACRELSWNQPKTKDFRLVWIMLRVRPSEGSGACVHSGGITLQPTSLGRELAS